MVMHGRWGMPAGLRRALALVAIVALAVGGAKVVDDHTLPGSSFSTVATVAADPTGPPGPTGGMTDGGGSQFQPPQMPSSMPDYQGGNNQPPLDQNSGISIYNSGSPQAPQQVPGQQGAQQPQQAQQPAHGTQIPDYQTATPYTQGPGKANPDYQAPQQNSPQQPQQGQQPQQPNQQQPQNKQDDTTQQLDQQQQQRQQQCMSAAQDYGIAEQMLSFMASAFGGAGSMFQQPSRKVGPDGQCNCAPEQAGPQEPQQEPSNQSVSDRKVNCEAPRQTATGDDLDFSIPNTGRNLGGDPGKIGDHPKLDGVDNPLNPQFLPKDQRPISTGTALGPQGKQYAFYSTPKYHNPDGTLNEHYVTPNSAIVDLAHPDKIIGNSPLAQTSGAFDPKTNTMLLAGNTSADPDTTGRALYQSAPIDPKNPNSWINGPFTYIGPLLSGSRESQLIALGTKGEDGFFFAESSAGRAATGVLASTAKELTEKTVGDVLVDNVVSNIGGVDGVYAPTITKQGLDSATKMGSLELKVSQFWDPAWMAANREAVNSGTAKVPYSPRIYTTNCTIQ